MILIDTSAWFALLVPWDQYHDAAAQWMHANREPMLTTDYIVSETLMLLRRRREHGRALDFAASSAQRSMAGLYHIDSIDFTSSLDTFKRFADKEWSFTDCTSKIVMERLGITMAFAFDHHFKQFGNVSVVPEPTR